MFNSLSEMQGVKKTKLNMNTNQMILMLQYRIQRYQAMGNGTMCQTLLSQLNKLRATKVATQAQ